MPSAEGRVDELKQLQGAWTDAAGNKWEVKDYKAVVALAEGGSQTHFLSVLPAGRVGLLDARVTRFEQKGMQWSDGDRWVRGTDATPPPPQPAQSAQQSSEQISECDQPYVGDCSGQYQQVEQQQTQQVVRQDQMQVNHVGEIHRLQSLLSEKDATIKNLMQKVADLEYQLEHTTPFPFPPPRKPSIARDRSDSLPPTAQQPPADNPPTQQSTRRRAHSVLSDTPVMPPSVLRSASRGRDISAIMDSVSRETTKDLPPTDVSQQPPLSPSTPLRIEQEDVPPPMVVTTSDTCGGNPPSSNKPLSIIEIRRMKMGLMNNNKSAAAPTRRFG